MQTAGVLTTTRLILMLLAGISTAHAAATADQRSATLQAIHNLENPRNLSRPGPRGELGPYQFRESTWRTYTDEPFVRALDGRVSDLVAVRHYEWLKQRLERANLAVTPYTIALAWNGGVTAAINGRAPRAARNYAERAANLAAVLAKETAMADAR